MTATLATKINIVLSAAYEDTDDIDPRLGSLAFAIADSLADGTADNQADLFFADRRTLTATSEDLDLAGSLTDAKGNTLTFVEIVAILIHNRSTTATEKLAVGGAAANQFINWVANSSDIVNIGPDGILLLWSPVDGYGVTAGTGDLLKIDAGSDTIIYDILLVGRSAAS